MAKWAENMQIWPIFYNPIQPFCNLAHNLRRLGGFVAQKMSGLRQIIGVTVEGLTKIGR